MHTVCAKRRLINFLWNYGLNFSNPQQNKTKQNKKTTTTETKTFHQRKMLMLKSAKISKQNTCTNTLSGKEFPNMQNRNVNAGNGPKTAEINSNHTEMREKRNRPKKNVIWQQQPWFVPSNKPSIQAHTLTRTHHFVKFNVLKYFMYENLEILSNTHINLSVQCYLLQRQQMTLFSLSESMSFSLLFLFLLLLVGPQRNISSCIYFYLHTHAHSLTHSRTLENKKKKKKIKK